MTNEKLSDARVKEALLHSSSDSYYMANFMNNLIERKYESMCTTTNYHNSIGFNASVNTTQQSSFPAAASTSNQSLHISHNPLSLLHQT
jgi:hypothetical protein